MQRANAEKLRKIKSDDLKEGMTVAVERWVRYGWNSYYRHPTYEKTSVSRIMPKRTKAVLDDGTEVRLNGDFSQPSLYEYGDFMEEETKKAETLSEGMRLLSKVVGNVSGTTLAGLSDEDVAEIVSALRLISDKCVGK